MRSEWSSSRSYRHELHGASVGTARGDVASRHDLHVHRYAAIRLILVHRRVVDGQGEREDLVVEHQGYDFKEQLQVKDEKKA